MKKAVESKNLWKNWRKRVQICNRRVSNWADHVNWVYKYKAMKTWLIIAQVYMYMTYICSTIILFFFQILEKEFEEPTKKYYYY